MQLVPYFAYQIKSTRTAEEVRDLLNTLAKRKKNILEEIDLNDELKISAKGKNRFTISTPTAKWLVVDGILIDNHGTLNVHLTFRQRTFTYILQAVVIALLLTQIILEGRPELIAFLLLIYTVNQLHFNWKVQKLRARLNQLLT